MRSAEAVPPSRPLAHYYKRLNGGVSVKLPRLYDYVGMGGTSECLTYALGLCGDTLPSSGLGAGFLA